MDVANLIGLFQQRFAAGEIEYLTTPDGLIAAVPSDQAETWATVIAAATDVSESTEPDE